MIALQKIVSGGQTGVDQAALETAIECGLQCDGWSPPDGRDEDGNAVAEVFGLQPTPHDTSPLRPDVARSQRTEWNICCSDATLIFCPAKTAERDAGTAWTRAAADLFRRPWKLIEDPQHPAATSEIIGWLEQQIPPARWLNVAGPSRKTLERLVGPDACREFLAATRAVLRTLCSNRALPQ
jgi:hypothetical protein